MVKFSSKALLAAALLSASEAFIPEGQIDRTGAIYKTIRTVLGSENRKLRSLQATLSAQRCFQECIELQLTPEQCVEKINEIIGEAGHEVGPVSIKIQTPRTDETLSETYWMVEVPVNVNNQMTCDRNDGYTYYPFSFPGGPDSVGPPVPNLNCQGLSAGDCCAVIRDYGRENFGRDESGSGLPQCLGCFPHQEPLIPVVGAGGATEYQDYEYSESPAACNQVVYDRAQVEEKNAALGESITAAVAALNDMNESKDCTKMDNLLAVLYNASVTNAQLPRYIGEMACQLCYLSTDNFVDDEWNLYYTLIKEMLQVTTPPESVENVIIIYTDADDNIVDVPKLGGSRADDPYDDDCPEEPAGGGDHSGGDGVSGPPGEGEGPTGGEEGPTGEGEGEGPTGEGDGPDDESEGPDRQNPPTCYTPPSLEPVAPLGTYTAPMDSCTPSADNKNSAGLDYSLTFLQATTASDGSSTTFEYDVCTAVKSCDRRNRQLKGPGFLEDAAISHWTLGIKGSCTIVGFAMYDQDDSSMGTDFTNDPALTALGKDPTTCVPGFKFDEGWDNVSTMSGCATGDFCRQMSVTVAGSVPLADNGSAAIKASTGFTTYDVAVPDCSVLCE